MRSLRVGCPAKINLALRLLGRRPDGYHEIATVFQAIDLWDDLEASAEEDLVLEASDPMLPLDGRNLVRRAADLLRERHPACAGRGARLRLTKRIPVAAGLGGGSSDAAGALLLLDALWDLRLETIELRALAAELGSDVPFFLAGGTALGTGRGETITPLDPIRERAVVLGSPSFGLSTARVYGAVRAPLTAQVADVSVPRLLVKLAEGNDFALAVNDLEAAAFGMRPELSDFRDALMTRGAEVALLSGSGSTVFGLFRSRVEASSASTFLRAEFPGWTLRESRTVASGVRFGS